MKVKFASTWNEREAIIQKHGYDIIAGTTMYVRKVEKPFFIGFAILDMFKHIIYDFYYNVLKNTFDTVELLGQDTDSLIVQLSDKGNIVHKMCDMYKSFDFSELDNTSYFYGELVNYYDHEVDKTSSLHWSRSSISTRSCLDPSSRMSTTDIASRNSLV